MGLLIPVGLIALITVVDTVTPADIVLGPLLVIAPALTAWFEGPWTTGGIGVLAVAAQTVIGWRSGLLISRGLIVQIVALAVLTALIVVMCAVRDRGSRQLAQVRTVAGAAQRVLLWPLPNRLGTLRLACLYVAAEDEAQIGGDLYAAAHSGNAVRLMIGDVRGKGLSAIGEAAVVLGAFREAAHQHAGLPELAAALDRSVARYLADFEPESEAGERFVTALLLEFPDDEPVVRLTSCGHVAPLLLAADGSVSIPHLHPAPPLGIALTGPEDHALDTMPFAAAETLLLYTDGVIEARDRDGTFYPLADRAARWAGSDPDALLRHLSHDLTVHTGGRLGDDVALVGVRRASTSASRHRLGHARRLGELHRGVGSDQPPI